MEKSNPHCIIQAQSTGFIGHTASQRGQYPSTKVTNHLRHQVCDCPVARLQEQVRRVQLSSSRFSLELEYLLPVRLWEAAEIKARLDICMRHTLPGNLLQEPATYLIKRPSVRSGQPGRHQHVSRELTFHGPSRMAAKPGL